MDDPVALPGHSRQGRGDTAEAPRLEQVFHHPMRKTRDAESFRCGVLDRFRASQLDASPVRPQVRQQQLVGGLPRAGTRFAQQPDELAQSLHGNALADARTLGG